MTTSKAYLQWHVWSEIQLQAHTPREGGTAKLLDSRFDLSRIVHSFCVEHCSVNIHWSFDH